MEIAWLFILGLPIACVAWTVTHEELFKEFHNYCLKCSKNEKRLVARKFFYLFTCEFCFSFYVTLGFLLLTGYKLMLDDWRGYIVAAFALVWVANLYMSIFGKLRTDLKAEKTEIELKEKELNDK